MVVVSRQAAVGQSWRILMLMQLLNQLVPVVSIYVVLLHFDLPLLQEIAYYVEFASIQKW
jgi:hypothetical protein